MQEAKRYPEGYAVRVEIVTPRDIDAIEKLALAKLENCKLQVASQATAGYR